MEYWKSNESDPIKYFCEFDQIWKIEEFKELPNFDGIYYISDLGRVKCLRGNKIKLLKQRISPAGYLRTTLHFKGVRKTRHIHQLVVIVFYGFEPNGQELVPNHKNFIKTDNRKLNLEIITIRENSNRKHLKSSSNYVGVDYHKRTKKWRARIVYKGELLHLGLFDLEINASKAYNQKLKEINGE